jgi:hypothetical protein
MSLMIQQPLKRADDNDGMCSDDTVLPTQFWAIASDPRSEPEKRLMVAVLEEAIAVVVNGAARGTDDRAAAVRDAERWFASDDHRSTFAFATICDILGLDVGRVRHTVANWQRRQRMFRRPRLQAGRGRHQVRGRDRRRDPRRAA